MRDLFISLMINTNKTLEELLDSLASKVSHKVAKTIHEIDFSNSNQLEEYLTKPQVAEFFQVTQRTVDNWVKARLFNSYGIGNLVRFKRKEVQDAFTKISA